MNSDILSLWPIYDYVFSASSNALNGRSKSGREYGKLCHDLVSSIPEKQGFYLWDKYEKNGYWSNIYFGKAGFGKTSHLKSRILEELKDERFCFWRAKYLEYDLIKQFSNLFFLR